MKLIISPISIGLLILFISGCIPTQVAVPIKGTVINKQTGQPIEGINVLYSATAPSSTEIAITKENGDFNLDGINNWSPPLPFLACCSMKIGATLWIHEQGYHDWDFEYWSGEKIPDHLVIELTPNKAPYQL